MSPDGSWVFSAEGGVLAFVYVGGDTPATLSFPPPPDPPHVQMGAAEKRLQLRSLGVLTAELALDPGLDLSDEPKTLPPGEPPEKYWPTDADYEDILYVAGGHLGLWAIEAHPIAQYDNHAVRLDAGGPNGSPGEIHRFCTEVEVVEINGEEFLLALFARRDDNLLRVYRLQECRQALDQVRSGPPNASDLGHEVQAVASLAIDRHPQQGPDVYVGPRNATLAASYALSVAIDPAPDLSDLVGAGQTTPPVDVYVAALSGGLVRFRLFAVGSPSTVIAFETHGPVFGSDVVAPQGVAYHLPVRVLNGVQVNTSDLPAQWFLNHEARITTRSVRHGEISRSDPPYFMDVAVQNEQGAHYLYCAMGHLGWLRFDLAAHHFEYGMEIDHLEGRPAVARDATTGVPSTAPVLVSETAWRRVFDLDRPTSSPFLEPFEIGDAEKPNAMHAFQVALTRVGVGSQERTALVVNFYASPWTVEPRIKGPGRRLDQTFGQIGSTELEYLPLWRRETASCIAVYDDLGNLTLPFRYVLNGGVGQIVSRDLAGNDLANHTRATRVGGESLHVPFLQPDNGDPTRERLRVLHTDNVLVYDPGSQNPDNPYKLQRGNVCVSFIDLGGAGTNDPNAQYPAIVRRQTQMTGRYAFGASFASIDGGNLVVQGNNDFPVDPSAPVVSLGLETGAGSLGQLAPPTTTWTNPQDKRLDSGIQHDERSHFVLPAAGGGQELWMIGDRTVPLERGTFYYFGKHSYQSTPSGVPVVDLVGQWNLRRVRSRYGFDLHGYYRSMTSDPGFDAYTVAAASSVGTAPDQLDPMSGPAETFLTASRIGSPDGVMLFGRDTMLQHLPFLLMETPQDFRDDPWLREFDIHFNPNPPIPPPPRSPDWTFTLNSHPEWNNLDYPRRAAVQPNGSLAHSQQLFHHIPEPELTYTEPDFAGRTQDHLAVFPLKEIVSTYTFLPKFTALPLDAAGNSHAQVLGAPCGYASCPPNLSNALETVLAIDPNDPFPTLPNSNWGQNYHFLPIPSEYNATPPWADQFRRGFVSLWQMSGPPAFPTYTDPQNPTTTILDVDPWSRARRGTDPTPPNAWHPIERPAGSPDLDPLFLLGEGSSAFQLHFVDLTNDELESRHFALVVDFNGTVQAFDISDLLLQSLGPRGPVDVWDAPLDPLELHPPNIFDLATASTGDPGSVEVYVACTRVGVQVVTFDADTFFGGTTQRLVTPGSPHSVSVREWPQGKLLLVDDLMAGYRFYREP